MIDSLNRESRLNPELVKSYFPEGIENLLGVTGEQLSFFGIRYENMGRKPGGEWEKLQQFYLAVVGRELPAELRSLSFLKSRVDYIYEEGELFRDQFSQYYPSLEGTVPLLILRICGWGQPANLPYRVEELVRYADHEELRKRGLATSVVESVSRKLSSEGVKYLWVNSDWHRWPSGIKPLPVRLISEDIKEEIMRSIGGEYIPGTDACYDKFNECGFFIITDKALHDKEYQTMMSGLDVIRNSQAG